MTTPAPEPRTLGPDGLPVLDPARLPGLAYAEQVLDHYREARGGWLGANAVVIDSALAAARRLVLDGQCFADVQPGDSTSYQIVVVDLLHPLVEASRAARDRGARPELTDLELREYAARHGIAARTLGGEYLVSLANLRADARVFGSRGPHVPAYVLEHLGCSVATAHVVSAWLTALLDAVADLRSPS